MTLTAVLIGFIAAAPTQAVDWPKLLKDAQVANRAKLRSGHAAGRLTYVVKDLGEASVDFTVDWDGPLSFMTFEAEDATGVLFRRVMKGKASGKGPSHRMTTGKSLIFHNAESGSLTVAPLGRSYIDDLRHLPPWENWFNCCPPDSADGRPWADLINLPGGSDSPGRTYRYERDGDTVVQIREDPGIGVMKMWFSLKDDLNLVRSESNFDPKLKARFRKGTIRWGRADGVSVPESIDFVITSPAQKTHSVIEYHLVIKDVRPGKPDPVSFTYEWLASRIKTMTRVDNQLAKKRVLLNPPAEGAKGRNPRFQSLIEEAKKGFAKP